MHALCAIITKTRDEVQNIIHNHCDEDNENAYWDYALIGGRYANIIPVGNNVKNYERQSGPFRDIGLDECPFNGVHDFVAGDCKYVSVARIRNILRAECERQDRYGLLSPFKPYTIIISQNGDIIIDTDLEEQGPGVKAEVMGFIKTHPNYFLTIVDYHY